VKLTFLFSDIESSTALAERLGDGYAEVLADARALQRRVVETVGGREVDCRADELFCVFDAPQAAAAAALEIRSRHPETGVLVLSQHVAHTYAVELLGDSAEGLGYLLKDRVADVAEFVSALRRVADGGSALDPLVVAELVGRTRHDDPIGRLSPREREVLELMAEGRSNQAIGQRLFISPRAVEKHVTSIFTKLRLPPAAEDHRRVLAVLRFLDS
jgi:DNA-binding NarL/FixJ family response regulator